MRLDRIRHVVAAGLAGVLAMASVASCSDDGGGKSTGGLEKSKVSVGILPIPYAAPIQIAQDRGFFAAEGLTVKTSAFTGGAQAMPKLLGGQIDIMLSNHVSVMQQHGKGIKMRILSEVDTAVPGEVPVVIKPGGAVRGPADLKGRKIAINTPRNLGELAVTSSLATQGVDVKRDKVQFVPVPFPEMPQVLAKGDVDAAWIAEPFLAVALNKHGARTLFDSMAGPTEGLPLDGLAATQKWVKSNPKTAAAFQRAITKAQQVAADDRKTVVAAVQKVARMDAKTASSIKLGTFVKSTSPARLQRLADLMYKHGFAEGRIDVRTML